MATIVLAAAGMAVGGSLGGTVLGLSTAVLGRAAGAALGYAIDQRLMGSGSAPVERGRVDRFRLTGASEGTAIPRIHGAVRVAGQVIWASDFRESATTEGGGGKGSRPQPAVTTYAYSVSLAIALCEGPISGVGRVWADGQEVARGPFGLAVYPGTEDQLPDPTLAAHLGHAPAFRGTAYVVIPDLDLTPYGGRVPQFSFEVIRTGGRGTDLSDHVQAVALIPGSGDYALATQVLTVEKGFGDSSAANASTPEGRADLLVSLDALQRELPRARAVSLVVSWFGDDLRAGVCTVRPKVEPEGADAAGMAWTVSGLSRTAAQKVSLHQGKSAYGGTPTDQSVVQAIRELKARGLSVLMNPFVLMDIAEGNALPDPHGGAAQGAYAWRGRITGAVAPGREGTTDGTATAAAEVAAFFGTAQPQHFARGTDRVTYTGPAQWSYRRMVLHCAHLCAVAGGVDAFAIGSEMVGLTSLRDATGAYPAVAALRSLAEAVKSILPGATVTYGADWSEWSGHTPPGTADRVFHLDPLWADPAIGAVGIDNYMALSDWRDGDTHADVAAGSVHDAAYLRGNVAGGELHDWYYATDADRAGQVRTPITDGDGEPWVWSPKAIREWWQNRHYGRVGGARVQTPTAWVPMSKPVWFTEYGCAAIDRGTNEPSKFLDPKSAESGLPRHSAGHRDDLMPLSYYRAHAEHWADEAANPVSPVYGGRMVPDDRRFAWAWDARPYPAFPARTDLWGDGPNHARGHWLQGRATARTAAAVVADLCAEAGAAAPDVSRLHGVVRGLLIDEAGPARATLEPVLLAQGADAVERDGVLRVVPRGGAPVAALDPDGLAVDGEAEATLSRTRAAGAERVGRVQVQAIEAGGDYAAVSAEAASPGDDAPSLSRSTLPLVVTRAEARALAERWLAETEVARETARFALPPSVQVGPGDAVTLDGATWRIDRVEERGLRAVEATRVERSLYRPADPADDAPPPPVAPALGAIEALFLDLPLMTGDEAPHAPHVALSARAWPGRVSLLQSATDAAYTLALEANVAATIGVTETPLPAAPAGLWDRGPALRLKLLRGRLEAVGPARVLAGAGLAAIGDGETWELFQFADAALVGPDTWALSGRLRGQAGTDGVMPPVWPVGSRVVLMDAAVRQWDYASSWRGLTREYRWGPSALDWAGPSWRHASRAFAGVGLRPYAVAHLRAAPDGAGGWGVTWVRRTRVDGDAWGETEVPLGETTELYRVRVTVDGTLRREVELAGPSFLYTAAMAAADGPGPRRIEVAQLSDRFGAGPSRVVTW